MMSLCVENKNMFLLERLKMRLYNLQIRDSRSLVPHIFFFLVLLSYEKYQSKDIITMSQIIQLCDGLMASGQGTVSHGRHLTLL